MLRGSGCRRLERGTLAASVGVDVPDRELTPEQRRAFAERAALQSATAAAAEHWSSNLWGQPGAKAREYLVSRGLHEDTLRSFRIGYAIADWHDLHKAIRARGGAVNDFQRAGLLVETEDGRRTYDRFRDRITFPLAGPDGHILGFGGRALTSGKSTDSGPKYLNGPETALFKKSRALFGIDKARDTIRRTCRAILVEGYMDVLALHQAGLPSTVGASARNTSSSCVSAAASRSLYSSTVTRPGMRHRPKSVAPSSAPASRAKWRGCPDISTPTNSSARRGARV